MNYSNYLNFAAIAVILAVGFGVRRANQRRSLNQGFFILSLVVAAWVGSLILTEGHRSDKVFWIRTTCVIGAFFPSLFWMIKYAVTNERLSLRVLKSGWPWLAFGFLMAGLATTGYFIPLNAQPTHLVMSGPGRKIYSVGIMVSYLALLIDAIWSVRRMQGLQRIEMQTIFLGAVTAAAVNMALASFGPTLGLRSPWQWGTLMVAGFYAATAWAVTTRKVFDAQFLFREGLRGLLSLTVVACLVWIGTEIGGTLMTRQLAALLCAFAIVIAIPGLNRWLWRANVEGLRRNVEVTRIAMLAAAHEPGEISNLINRFSSIISTWGQTEHTDIFTWTAGGFESERFDLPASSPETTALLEDGWATPESVVRQQSESRAGLRRFIEDHELGAIVSSKVVENRKVDGSGSVVIALGRRHDRRLYNWSDIRALKEWAAIVEGACARSELTQRARHAEQLATAGRLGSALAHEIRNPLVSLKTIVELAKTRYNEPEYRRLLTDIVPPEIERMEVLVTGLMDLGKPRRPKFERVHLGDVVSTTGKLVEVKAHEHSVKIDYALAASGDELDADRAGLRQIILNLIMNAIQAVADQKEKREVRVVTKSEDHSVILEVSDNGPGIMPKIKKQLFRPYASSKVNGMGLGLAVCEEIVRSHQGQIALVENGLPGATFRVVLPCRQLTS
jgi:signal transduction histidine kinase